MTIHSLRTRALVFFLSSLVISSVLLLAQTQPAAQPPEYKELAKAVRTGDPNARIKELERIRAAYPNSRYLAMIGNLIIAAKIELAPDIDSLLELQKSQLQSSQRAERPFSFYQFCTDILEHKNLARFDKKKVTQAVEQYAAEGLKLGSDPEFLKTVPPNQLDGLKLNRPNFYIVLAMAYLNEGLPEESLQALEDYKNNEGKRDKAYLYALGATYEKLGRDREALEGYFGAAIVNYKDSVGKARTCWAKIYGSSQDFEGQLEARQRELPFLLEPFKPEAGAWKGKVVLAELFTGSESPPCVAADLAFDGLIEAYGPRYVAVLEYHVPIPRPDPIVNMATRSRAQFYGVNSAPTAHIDGQRLRPGGGPRPMAEKKYKEYAAEINSRLSAEPETKLKVMAKLAGDDVQVRFSADKDLAGAEYHLVLVQKEEKYGGDNSIIFHKMVVRDFLTLDAAAVDGQSAQFNIPKAEQDAETRLSEMEKERGFTFKERHGRINRTNLLVVFFSQDKDTKKVYNAAVSEVEN